MVKKIFSLVLVLGILGVALSGCSKPAEGETGGATAGADATKTETK